MTIPYKSGGSLYSVWGTSNSNVFAVGASGRILHYSAEPIANFTFTPHTGNSPLIVNFTDTSVGSINSWSWNFGDGSVSTDKNPSHTYNIPGSYIVSLVVSGPDGSNTKIATDSITVLPEPSTASPWIPLLLLEND